PLLLQLQTTNSDQPLSTDSTDSPIYPLNLLAVLPLPHQMELWNIELASPIHIHTPFAHIATLSKGSPGSHIPFLEIFLFLQDLVTKPIDFRSTFNLLSPEMQTKVSQAYRHRCTIALKQCTKSSWERFTEGRPVREGGEPLGIDLLLGNSQVWGFELCSYGGLSVVHLAGDSI
ncbi:hypothetical protein AN958_04079, partial [Leucoagaricus sp. SymC.cos]